MEGIPVSALCALHRRAGKLYPFPTNVSALGREFMDMYCFNGRNVSGLVYSIPEDQGVNEPAAVDYRYMRRVWHYDNADHVLSISARQNNVIERE